MKRLTFLTLFLSTAAALVNVSGCASDSETPHQCGATCEDARFYFNGNLPAGTYRVVSVTEEGEKKCDFAVDGEGKTFALTCDEEANIAVIKGGIFIGDSPDEVSVTLEGEACELSAEIIDPDYSRESECGACEGATLELDVGDCDSGGMGGAGGQGGAGG